jgi:hypothetical protein
MPLSPYAEPKLLDQILGVCVGQVNQVISAGTAAQTSLTTRGSAGSGNMDITPANGEIYLCMTPGTGATQNQYTAWDVFMATGGTATSITFASRTVVAARAVGDYVFRIGTTTTFDRHLFLNTVYVGLSTAGATTSVAAGSDLATLPTGTITVVSTGAGNGGAALTNGGSFPASGNILIDSSLGLQTVAYTGVTATTFTGCTLGAGTIDTTSTVVAAPTSAVLLAGEPTATGSYARVAAVNNAANFSAATGNTPATKVNAATQTFPASTAAWSTGPTVLNVFFVADVSTLGGGNVLYYGYLTTAQAVNASGITPSVAPSAMVFTVL